MATLEFSLTIGALSTTATISPSSVRALEFIDDYIAQADEVDDGAGGTRPMTQIEGGQAWLDALMAGQIAWAKGLKQARLDAAVAVADDLEGN